MLLLASGIGGRALASDAALPVREVRSGESLWMIAADTLGDPFLWPAIYRANRDQIKNPSLVYPGQKLAIPELDAASRAALRREAGVVEPR
jgi:nucleoid-associated protein YgaU